MTGKSQVSKRGAPSWWVVFQRESAAMWFGGRLPALLFLLAIALGSLAFILASSEDINLIPPKELPFIVLKTALIPGAIFMVLITCADSISGDRERRTLEFLLLTPGSRRGIVFGKMLAALVAWPAALIVSIPFLLILSPDAATTQTSLLWGIILGTALVVGFAAVGAWISVHAKSNRNALAISLGVFILAYITTFFPQKGTAGRFFKVINPLEATWHFLAKLIVNNNGVGDVAEYLWAPILFGLLVPIALFLRGAPRLSLQGGSSA